MYHGTPFQTQRLHAHNMLSQADLTTTTENQQVKHTWRITLQSKAAVQTQTRNTRCVGHTQGDSTRRKDEPLSMHVDGQRREQQTPCVVQTLTKNTCCGGHTQGCTTVSKERRQWTAGGFQHTAICPCGLQRRNRQIWTICLCLFSFCCPGKIAKSAFFAKKTKIWHRTLNFVLCYIGSKSSKSTF